MPAGPHGRRKAPQRGSRVHGAPWWIAGSAAAVAGVVGVVVITSSISPPACAASGKATFYSLNAGSAGNCSTTAPADNLFVALPPAEYAAAAGCGSYLSVTGPKGTVRVKVIDQCPECEAGHIDLSAAAFARIANPVQGIVGVTYSTVVNPAVGDLTVKVKDGSSQYWLALLVDNTGNAIRSVQVRSGSGSWKSLARADYNFWLADGGAGSGPFQVRVTDVQGHQVTLPSVKLLPGATQSTGVGMYSGVAAAATTSKNTTSKKRTTSTSSRRTTLTSGATTVAATATATTPAPATVTTGAPEPPAPAPALERPAAEAASSRC